MWQAGVELVICSTLVAGVLFMSDRASLCHGTSPIHLGPAEMLLRPPVTLSNPRITSVKLKETPQLEVDAGEIGWN